MNDYASTNPSAASLRAGHVQGLQNELDYLERQPSPNKARIAQVKEQLDAYADEPKQAKRETAAATPATPPPADPPETPETRGEGDDKPAAKKAAPAKKAAAKKPAAKKAAAPAKKAAAAPPKKG